MVTARLLNASSMVFVVGSSEWWHLPLSDMPPSRFLCMFFMSAPFVADTVEAFPSRPRCPRRSCEVTV